jgi:hypothetical protein
MRYFLIFFLFTYSLLAQEELNGSNKYIGGSKEIPSELNLLLESFQREELEAESFQKLLKHAHAIDSLAKMVTKEELFFITKTEIYKTFLKNVSSTKVLIDGADAKLFLQASKKATDPFIKWLLQALATDADNVINSSFYKDFTAEKSVGLVKSENAKRIQRSLQLLSRFYVLINIEHPNMMKSDLFNSYDESLTNVEAALFLVASESHFEKLEPISKIDEPFKFFTLKNRPKKKDRPVPKNTSKSVEDIIDDVPETLEEEAETLPSSINLPKPSSEDWTKEDSSPIDIKKLPKPADDADWLQDF